MEFFHIFYENISFTEPLFIIIIYYSIVSIQDLIKSVAVLIV